MLINHVPKTYRNYEHAAEVARHCQDDDPEWTYYVREVEGGFQVILLDEDGYEVGAL